MNQQPLAEYGQAVVNAAGTAAFQIGPKKFNESWQIAGLSVSASSNVKEPKFQLFKGNSNTITALINGTYAGSFDNDPDFSYFLPPSGLLTCLWTGADVGATVTAVFYGTQMFA